MNPSRRCLTYGAKCTFCGTKPKKLMNVLDKSQVFKEIVFNKEIQIETSTKMYTPFLIWLN